jgi:predicted nuclease of predicted toxin-antitoxin system
VKGILADVNIQKYVQILVAIMQSEDYKLFWDHLQIQYLQFADVGLASNALDTLIWQTCQQRELILITDNRNQDDNSSLESTIRLHNTPLSLPVFTISNISRLRNSREYLHQVVESLLDALLRVESLRGTGRLFLP